MGKLDDFFKVANDIVDQVEGALKAPEPEEPKPDHGPHFKDTDDAHAEWENAWQQGEVGWAVVLKGKLGEGYHGFRPKQVPDTRRAVCGATFKPEDVGTVGLLDHGKRLVICTSCVIGVTK